MVPRSSAVTMRDVPTVLRKVEFASGMALRRSSVAKRDVPIMLSEMEYV